MQLPKSQLAQAKKLWNDYDVDFNRVDDETLAMILEDNTTWTSSRCDAIVAQIRKEA